jgi:hypothetical protein
MAMAPFEFLDGQQSFPVCLFTSPLQALQAANLANPAPLKGAAKICRFCQA